MALDDIETCRHRMLFPHSEILFKEIIIDDKIFEFNPNKINKLTTRRNGAPVIYEIIRALKQDSKEIRYFVLERDKIGKIKGYTPIAKYPEIEESRFFNLKSRIQTPEQSKKLKQLEYEVEREFNNIETIEDLKLPYIFEIQKKENILEITIEENTRHLHSKKVVYKVSPSNITGKYDKRGTLEGLRKRILKEIASLN